MPRLSPSEKLNKNNNSPLNSASSTVSAEDRERMIRETAFYLAEREGFTSDNHIYWLRAEEQIDKMLNG